MARWTDLARWVGPTPNDGDGDSNDGEAADRMTAHRGVIIHIAAGYYAGTIAWQRNPSADVSSHFIVSKSGEISQMVDTDIRSWAQRSGNPQWLSIENEGFLPQPLTSAQVEANARILAKAHQVYGVPLQLATSPSGKGLGHHSMGAESGADWGHSACPGPAIKAQKPQILARAIQIINGGNDMELSDKLTGNTGWNGRTVDDTLTDLENMRNWAITKVGEAAEVATPMPGSPFDLLLKMAQAFPQLVDSFRTLTTTDLTDEDEIVAGVLSGLGGPGISLETTATALRSALGPERAAELGVLLAS